MGSRQAKKDPKGRKARLAQYLVFAQSEAHGKAEVGPKKAEVGTKMSQDRAKMGQDGRTEMGGILY